MRPLSEDSARTSCLELTKSSLEGVPDIEKYHQVKSPDSSTIQQRAARYHRAHLKWIKHSEMSIDSKGKPVIFLDDRELHLSASRSNYIIYLWTFNHSNRATKEFRPQHHLGLELLPIVQSIKPVCSGKNIVELCHGWWKLTVSVKRVEC